MAGLYSKYIKPIHFTGDVIIVNSSFLISYYVLFRNFQEFSREHYFSLLVYYNLAWIATAYFLKGYQLYRVTGFVGILVNLIRPLLFFFLLIVAFNGITIVLGYSRLLMLFSFAFISTGIIFWRLTLYILLRFYRRSGRNYRRVVIAGFSEASLDLYDFFLGHPEHGYRFMGFFDDKEKKHYQTKGSLNDIQPFCLENEVDEIYCLSSELNNDQLEELIEFADKHFLRIKLVPDPLGLKYKNFKLDLYGYLPIISVRNIPLDDSINKFIKRSFDIGFSFFVCVFILSWVIPLLAVIIKIDSPGPVFFRQKRSGLNNKEFWCYKLRSMRMTIDAHTKQATRD
ncbi:MAG TPA: sugar transferase, partial [Bacteroidia bacterium]